MHVLGLVHILAVLWSSQTHASIPYSRYTPAVVSMQLNLALHTQLFVAGVRMVLQVSGLHQLSPPSLFVKLVVCLNRNTCFESLLQDLHQTLTS